MSVSRIFPGCNVVQITQGKGSFTCVEQCCCCTLTGDSFWALMGAGWQQSRPNGQAGHSMTAGAFSSSSVSSPLQGGLWSLSLHSKLFSSVLGCGEVWMQSGCWGWNWLIGSQGCSFVLQQYSSWGTRGSPTLQGWLQVNWGMVDDFLDCSQGKLFSKWLCRRINLSSRQSQQPAQPANRIVSSQNLTT